MQGFRQVRELLQLLEPHIRFKKKQAKLLIQACTLLEESTLRTMTPRSMRTVADLLLAIQSENYMSKGRRTKEDLYQLLGLTP